MFTSSFWWSSYLSLFTECFTPSWPPLSLKPGSVTGWQQLFNRFYRLFFLMGWQPLLVSGAALVALLRIKPVYHSFPCLDIHRLLQLLGFWSIHRGRPDRRGQFFRS